MNHRYLVIALAALLCISSLQAQQKPTLHWNLKHVENCGTTKKPGWQLTFTISNAPAGKTDYLLHLSVMREKNVFHPVNAEPVNGISRNVKWDALEGMDIWFDPENEQYIGFTTPGRDEHYKMVELMWEGQHSHTLYFADDYFYNMPTPENTEGIGDLPVYYYIGYDIQTDYDRTFSAEKGDVPTMMAYLFPMEGEIGEGDDDCVDLVAMGLKTLGRPYHAATRGNAPEGFGFDEQCKHKTLADGRPLTTGHTWGIAHAGRNDSNSGCCFSDDCTIRAEFFRGAKGQIKAVEFILQPYGQKEGFAHMMNYHICNGNIQADYLATHGFAKAGRYKLTGSQQWKVPFNEVDRWVGKDCTVEIGQDERMGYAIRFYESYNIDLSNPSTTKTDGIVKTEDDGTSATLPKSNASTAESQQSVIEVCDRYIALDDAAKIQHAMEQEGFHFVESVFDPSVFGQSDRYADGTIHIDRVKPKKTTLKKLVAVMEAANTDAVCRQLTNLGYSPSERLLQDYSKHRFFFYAKGKSRVEVSEFELEGEKQLYVTFTNQ